MPTFDETYPSFLWDQATYVDFVGQYLGPALASSNLGTKVMLGAFANWVDDVDIVQAAVSDPQAGPFVASIAVWVTESKCGNYPFMPTGAVATTTYPAIEPYMEPAPNDQSYAVEAWWNIRDAITKGNVSAYNAVHMVLDPFGQGNDTTRAWS